MSQVSQVSIERCCELGRVSRAGFYRDWQKREPGVAEIAIRGHVQREALARRFYGYRRITASLKKQGVAVGETVGRRILRTDNLLAIKKRKFVVVPGRDANYRVYPNLAQHVEVKAINQLWVADITYIRLQRDFVYLAVVIDVFSRKVGGWALSRNINSHLTQRALTRALEQRRPGPGLFHHSDRGSQYASSDYVSLLEKHQIVMSMSGPGRPWENAFCESFMQTLKNEEINGTVYITLEHLESRIQEFIERFYNPLRLHSALRYCSPEEFERDAKPADTRLPYLQAALSFPRHQEIYPDASSLGLAPKTGWPAAAA